MAYSHRLDMLGIYLHGIYDECDFSRYDDHQNMMKMIIVVGIALENHEEQ